MQKPKQAAQSVFGTAATITGDLDSEDPVRIEGIMEGDVRGTEVTVGRNAAVKGTIRAKTVRIAGSVEGRIEATAVVVEGHARIIGEVTCHTLAIEAGAEIGARCKAWPEEAVVVAETNTPGPGASEPSAPQMEPTPA